MLKLALVLCVVYIALRYLHRQITTPPSEVTPPTKSTSLTVTEACDILGVTAEASDDDIKAAHHRMMKHLHPDNGGSHYFATRLNMARDLLLSKK